MAFAFALALLAFAGFAPGAAQAAPTWVAPVDFTGTAAEGPEVGVDAQGNAVAVWMDNNGVQAATRAAGGGWSARQTLSPSGINPSVNPRVAVDAQGNAVAVWAHFDGTTYVVQASIRPAGGGSITDGWSAPQDLSLVDKLSESPDAAFDGKGNAVAVWYGSDRTSGDYVVQASRRPAGGGSIKDGWSVPRELSAAPGQVSGTRVATDAKGDAIAVWSRHAGSAGTGDQIVAASSRPAGGGALNDGWGAPQDLSLAGRDAQAAQVALDAEGNAIVVWNRRVSAPFVLPASTVQAVTRPAGGGSVKDGWSAPQDLTTAAQVAFNPQVEIDGKGNAVAVWTSGASSLSGNIQAATRPAEGGSANGGWSAPQDISPVQSNAAAPRLAMNSDGKAVLVWRRFEGSNAGSDTDGAYVVVAATRAASGAWGTPQDLTVLDPVFPSPDVDIDSQGNAVALWTASSPINASQQIVRAAGYDAAGPQLRDMQVPGEGTTGSPVSFSVAPVDVWSPVASTRWDFGDGTAADGKSVSHGYSAPGSYEVTVTSTDSLNNVSSEKRTVVVTGAAAAPPPATPSTDPAGETAPAPAPAGAGSTGAVATTVVTTPGSVVPGPAPATGFGGAPSVIERSALSRCRARARRLKTARAQSKARAACARPGRVGGLKARAAASRTVKLSFLAPGAVSRFAPAARRYVVKQSFKPIRSERSFRAATTLCRRSCSFAPARVGQRLELTVTDLKPRTTYYYAIKAVGAAQRTGPRSIVVKVTTR